MVHKAQAILEQLNHCIEAYRSRNTESTENEIIGDTKAYYADIVVYKCI